MRVIEGNQKKKKSKISPYLFVINTFLGVIAISSILLMLPFSTKDGSGLNFIDALFTSTSAVCVTGLSVVSNVGDTFTVFGKIVLALTIEIGGLSFMTLAIFVVILIGAKIGIRERFLMREALNQDSAQEILKLVIIIVSITLTFQLVGAIVNMFVFTQYYPFFKALGISIFHSISSFNNAGFDIFGSSILGAGSNSMISFTNNILLNINTCLLVIIGGLGFIVIVDIYKKRKWNKFSLHTKIVLSTTITLLLLGTVLLKFFMRDVKEFGWLQAMFLSVSSRTAGFATFPIDKLNNSAIFIVIILMFIGASPCSTGGGIKTVTIFVLFKAIISIGRGTQAKAFYRKISDQSIIKAFALITFSITFISIMVMLLCTFEPSTYMFDGKVVDSFKPILFESFSAFGTVGLSTGITPQLQNASKIIICILMFVGRLGPLTFMNIWNRNWMTNKDSSIRYVDEKVIIG